MRRRLIAALVGVALGTLLLYAGPRAFMITDMVREREELGLSRTADLVAEGIELRREAGFEVDEALLSQLLAGRDDVQITVASVDGATLQVGDVGDDAEAERRSLADGGAVTVALDADTVDRRVAAALVPIALFALAATAFAVTVAVIVARRLSTPFVRLAGHAELLGMAEAGPAPRAGVPEADGLADALDRSQARIAELVRHEREFSSNASHQLRTPLAALRLRIEDVSTWPEATPEVRQELDAALNEVDRLAATVTDLLELARSSGIGAQRELDVHRTAEAAAARWQARFDETGRLIAVHPPAEPTLVTTSERAVDHVLDVLLENALVHGAGTVDLRMRDEGGRVVLRIADEGRFDESLGEQAFQRRARSAASTGSGIGLDLAQSIARSAGARLVLATQDPTAFELTLPRHGGPTEA